MALIKAFLKAGILTELGGQEETLSGTPQGSLCAAAHNAPYEQRWVMRSVRLDLLLGAGLTAERCA